MSGRRFVSWGGRQRWLLLVFLVGFAHASAYALLVPLWQAPDEPGHVEAACLLGEMQRPLTGDDLSPSLQHEILNSLARQDFWSQVGAPTPAVLPASFASDPFLARSGRQVGDEPPLYYLIPALICRANLSMEARLRLIRLFGALLFGLTGVVSVWGLRGDNETRKQGNPMLPRVMEDRSDPLVSLSTCLLAYSLPLFLVLLPMPAFIAGSANNDALAMLTATAVFAAVLRVRRLGWRWSRGLGILALTVLALASKKTNSFLVLWLALLALAAGWRVVARRGWRRQTLVGLAVGLAVALLCLWLPSPAPAGWRSTGLFGNAAHRLRPGDARAAEAPGARAVLVADRSIRRFERLFQAMEGPAVLAERGRIVQATAWVRSPEGKPTNGRLTLRDAAGFSQAGFMAGEAWQRVSISHTVALTTTYLKLAVAAGAGETVDERGDLALADVAVSTQDGANLLRNGDFARAARWGELAVIAPLEERWQQFAPQLRTEEGLSIAALRRYGLYGLLTFAGFWGNFGWLQRPLPVWLYALLAALCVVSATGVARLFFGSRRSPWRSWLNRGILKSWLLALALAAGLVFLPMLGRPWQPQGRYLFPALLPIVGLMLAGFDAWFDLERHPRRLVLLTGGEIGLVAVSLIIASAY